MTTYRYRGQSLDGAKVTGVIRAYDEFEAVSQLRDRCAFITKIEPVKEKQGNPLPAPSIPASGKRSWRCSVPSSPFCSPRA